MLEDKIKELQRITQQKQKLEAEIAESRSAELASLPGRFGYSDVKDFVKALLAASGGRMPRKAAGETVKKRGKRARVTPEMREEILAAARAGETGPVIAKRFGVSVPTVQNIKKAAGLVKARASSEGAPAVPAAEDAGSADMPSITV